NHGMSVKLWLVALCVLCLILVAVGQKSSPKAEAAALSRYQLVPAQVDSLAGEKVQHTVFLLDTQTGKVWKYVASGQPKTLKEKDQTSDLSGGSTIVGLTPGTFVPVDRIEVAPPKATANKEKNPPYQEPTPPVSRQQDEPQYSCSNRICHEIILD